MKVDKTLIRHLEALARLELSPAERERLGADLARILDYVAQLDALDLQGVPPTAQVLEIAQALREDAPGPSLPQDEVLRSAARAQGGYFLLPPVIGQDADRA